MKILVAEDDRDLNATIKRVLEFSGYEVDTVFNGLEALEKLSEREYDGFVTDLMMPKLDGLSTLKTLRANGNNIPVLILTAKSELDDKVEGLDAGADDYLAKPFEIKELLARVRAILRRKGANLNDGKKFGDFTLDPNTSEIICKERVRLTAKEYKMLEVFILNAGALLSTETLMVKVRDYDTLCEINVVWQFISTLRKKLKASGSKYTVVAVRGIGYKLDLEDD